MKYVTMFEIGAGKREYEVSEDVRFLLKPGGEIKDTSCKRP